MTNLHVSQRDRERGRERGGERREERERGGERREERESWFPLWKDLESRIHLAPL